MTQAWNLSQLANSVNSSGQLDASTALYNTSSLGFPTGTRMAFQQTAAPTGWTKDTTSTINDSLLRLVTGTVSTGGTAAFSTWNSSGTTGAYTLATTDIPAHTHAGTSTSTYAAGGAQFGTPVLTGTTGNTGSTGGGGSHSHPLSNNIKYYDFIIATKN